MLNFLQVVELEPQFNSLLILDNKGGLPSEVFLSIGVDDGEFTLFEDCVLQVYTQQQQVRQLNDVHGAETPFPQKIRPVFLGIFVIDTVLEIVRK